MTVFLGYLQYKISKQQLQSQLYDRRLKAYEVTKEFLLDLHQNHPLEDDAIIRRFVGVTSDVQFLFGKNSDVYTYMDDLNKRSLKILWEDRKNQARSKADQLWLLEQVEVLADKFERHLSMRM